MSVKISYTSRDFTSILDEVKSQLVSELPESNDFLESNVGRFFMDYFAAVADMTAFYIDRSAAECFIDTLESRSGLISLLKLLNFQPKNPIPASCEVNFQLSEAQNIDITIPKYTRLRSGLSGKDYITSEDATLVSGATTVAVNTVQGVWTTSTFTGTGAVNQSFLIASKNVADSYIRVFVDGVEWSKSDNNTFVSQLSTSTVFTYENNAQQYVRVNFGNGTEGKNVPLGSSVEVRWLVTEGIGGSVQKGELTTMLDTISDYSFSVINSLPSTTGQDFETIDSARKRYPSVFRTMDRAVTLSDWEALASNVEGVMQAHAADINTDSAIPFFNVKLYVIGDGGVTSSTLNAAVKSYLDTRRVNATVFEVISPTAKLVDVSVSLSVLNNYSVASVQAAVIRRITDFFTMTSDSTTEVSLGKTVFLSKLTAAIQGVSGVSSFSYGTSPSTDIEVGDYEYAKLNNLSVTIKGTV